MEEPRKTSLLAALDGRADENQQQLQEQLGFFGRMAVQGKQKKRLVDVSDRLNEVRAEVIYDVGRTALELSRQQLCSTLVANSLLKIGAQTHVVNAQGAAVDQRLTRGALTEAACHMRNRAESIRSLDALVHNGDATATEVDELAQVTERIARQDIARSFERMQKSKDAVQSLVDRANDSIRSVKTRS